MFHKNEFTKKNVYLQDLEIPSSFKLIQSISKIKKINGKNFTIINHEKNCRSKIIKLIANC